METVAEHIEDRRDERVRAPSWSRGTANEGIYRHRFQKMAFGQSDSVDTKCSDWLYACVLCVLRVVEPTIRSEHSPGYNFLVRKQHVHTFSCSDEGANLACIATSFPLCLGRKTPLYHFLLPSMVWVDQVALGIRVLALLACMGSLDTRKFLPG